MSDSKDFADWTTLRTIQAQAVATYTLREILRRLDRLEREIAAAIFSADLDGRNAPGKQRQALAEFKTEVEEKIATVYRELLSRTEGDFATLAEQEDEAQRMAFPVFGKVRESAAFNVSAMVILGATLRQWFSRQAGDLQFRTVQAMRQGLEASEAPAKLAERIKGGTDAAGIDTSPLVTASKRAAETVIRTGATQIQGEITLGLAERLPASIDYGWQQISILDGRTTQICRAYAFKIWTKTFAPVGHKLPFAGGVPRHPNCLPGDALVLPVGEIASVSKRWYEGRMIRFKTARGYKLSCTPNHPILTPAGWIGAQFLNQGSRVICDSLSQSPIVNEAKNDNRISSIEQIVESFLVSNQFRSMEVPTSAPNFHGDGAESKVAVIGTDRSLSIKNDASIFQEFGKLPLIVGSADGIHATDGTLTQLAEAGFTTSYGDMSALRKSFAFSRGGAAHSCELLLAPIAYRDASFDQRSRNGGMTTVENVRNAFNSDARSVKLDHIVRIESYTFHGYVYNIETSSGYYFSNGVATHNCRSRIVPYMMEDGPTKELTFREWMDTLTAKQQEQVFGRERIAAWKAGRITDGDLIRQQTRAIDPDNLNEQ